MEQEYPPVSTEKKILVKNFNSFGLDDGDYVNNLVNWADIIRKTYYDGGVDEVISTRRLDHIVKAFAIFGDKMKSIELCVARFDEDTKASFMDLNTKIDAGVLETESDEGAVSSDDNAF